MEGVVAGDATELLLDLRFASASRRASSKLCVELERDVTTFVCNEEIKIFLRREQLKKLCILSCYSPPQDTLLLSANHLRMKFNVFYLKIQVVLRSNHSPLQ